MKSLIPIIVALIATCGVAAQPKTSLAVLGQYVRVEESSRVTFIKKDHIISISVLNSDESVNREKPALVITTTGFSARRHTDHNDPGAKTSTMASESLSYYFVFETYEKATETASSLAE